MPMALRHQGASGWACGCMHPLRLSPHTGQVAAACSNSRVLGGRQGQGACCSRSLLLAASGPGDRKQGVRGSQSPPTCLVCLSIGDII